MGATFLPRSLASRGPAAALPQACASSTIRINPACVTKPAGAGAKRPKGRGSFDHEDPPAKRARGDCGGVGPDAAAATATAAGIKKRPHPSPISDGDPPRPSPRHGVAALGVTKNQASASPTQPPPKPLAGSMRELLEKARLAKNQTSASPPKLLEEARPAAAAAEAEAIHRREIERRRAEVRRELEQMVQTVEFNDPFIDPLDVLK